MATVMGRNLSETHTVWTNDIIFYSKHLCSASCLLMLKHQMGGKALSRLKDCYVVLQAFHCRFIVGKLGFWIIGMYSIFFLASVCCLFSVYIFFFSSEKFPVPSEWFVNLSPIFFPCWKQYAGLWLVCKSKSSFQHMCYLVYTETINVIM